MTEIRPKAWIYHTEWLGLMATIVGCFLFVHKECIHTNERLDEHMSQTNEAIAQINRRCDELHKEFYTLLKQMNKDRGG